MATAAFYQMPAQGHINPTLPVLGELVRRGDRVLVYATPDLRGKLAPTGAEFRAYPPFSFDHERPPENLGELGAKLLQFAVDAAEGLIAEAARERVEYVIHDSLACWGRAVATGLGVPSVCSTSTFAFPPGVPPSPKYALMKALLFARSAPWLPTIRARAARLHERFSLPPPGLYDLFRNRAELNLVYTSALFQPYAELLDPTYRFVGPSIPDTVATDPALFDELGDRRLIYVSLGTLFNDRPGFFRAALDALAEFDGRVLLSIGKKIDPRSLGPIPPNAVVRAFVPQLAVLQRTALFLTHGGMNSVSEGLYHGVPLLVYPQAGDQMLVAERVAEVGAGVRLGARDLAPSRLRALVRRVLEPPFAERARRIGASLRAAGGSREAVAQIERFKRRRGLGD